MKKSLLNLSVALLILLVTSVRVNAAYEYVKEIDGDTNGGTGIAAASNLLTDATLTSTDFTAYNNGQGTSDYHVLNDGSLGNDGVHASDTALDLSGSAWTLDLDLGGAETINTLDVISGWNGDAVNFDYTLAYSTDGGTNYTTVGSYLARAAGISGNFPDTFDAYAAASLESTLTDLDLVGVTNLEITFNPTASTSTFFGSPTMYDGAIREVEAFDYDVPEPSTYALLGAAGLAFLAYRIQCRTV